MFVVHKAPDAAAAAFTQMHRVDQYFILLPIAHAGTSLETKPGLRAVAHYAAAASSSENIDDTMNYPAMVGMFFGMH